MGRAGNRTERDTVSLDEFERLIVSLNEGAPEKPNLLFYGDSNAGKTHLTSTYPHKALWLVCEPGYKVAQRQGAKGFARRISDSATALAALDWLHQGNRAESIPAIIVDGLSTMENKIRLGYTAEAFDRSPPQQRARAHRNLPDRPDYFNTQNFIKSWIGALVDLPPTLIITAHAYRTDRTDNGELLVFPGIQGKVNEVANAISGLMDVVGYMECRRVKNTEGKSRERRRLWLSQPPNPDVRYIVGDKFGTLGPYMDNPTIPRIFERIGAYADANS